MNIRRISAVLLAVIIVGGVLQSCGEAAAEKQLDGWLITLDALRRRRRRRRP